MLLPNPDAKICNNLDEYLYRSTVNAQKGKTISKGHRKEPFGVPLVRNFERILKRNDESTPLQAKRIRPDVFSRTETSGPLSHLRSRMGQTITVLIRRRRKVPYLSRKIEYKGKLVLFDKHMNLFLENASESFLYQKEGRVLKRTRTRGGIIIRGDNVILVA